LGMCLNIDGVDYNIPLMVSILYSPHVL